MRSRSLALCAVLLSFSVAGCLSRGAVLAGSGAGRTERGRPIADPGPDAYLVWRDGDGWHLRARSDVPRLFHGVVEAGAFSQVRVVGVSRTSVRKDGDRIAFSFVGREREVGFDWTGLGCPELSLYVDDDQRTLRVFAGADGASPARMPFSVCP